MIDMCFFHQFQFTFLHKQLSTQSSMGDKFSATKENKHENIAVMNYAANIE